MTAQRTVRAVLLAVTLLAAMPMFAQQSSHATVTARIDDHAAANSSGRIAVNQASGAGNAQANLAAIVLSPGGQAGTTINSVQATMPGDRRVAADASISGAAFSGTSGALALNQVAGSGNQQVNAIAFGSGASSAIAITSVMDAVLAQTAGATSTEGAATTPPVRHASIGTDAFRGGRGVVQVNQTAGVGNLSTNAIVLQLPAVTP